MIDRLQYAVDKAYEACQGFESPDAVSVVVELLAPLVSHGLPARTFGDIAIDPVARLVQRAGKPVRLTRLEFDLLAVFMDHPRQVLSRGQIYEAVWGYDLQSTSNALGVLMGGLRRKLGEPAVLHTVQGIGFVLREDRAD